MMPAPTTANSAVLRFTISPFAWIEGVATVMRRAPTPAELLDEYRP